MYKDFKLVYPNKNAQALQAEVNLFWNSVKTKDNVVDVVNKKLCELGNAKRQSAASLLTFWSKVCKPTVFTAL